MEEISHEKQLSSRHTHHRAAQTLPMRRGTEVAVLYKPERKEVKWIEEMEGRSRVAPALSRSEEECGGGGEGRKMDGGKGHSHLYQWIGSVREGWAVSKRMSAQSAKRDGGEVTEGVCSQQVCHHSWWILRTRLLYSKNHSGRGGKDEWSTAVSSSVKGRMGRRNTQEELSQQFSSLRRARARSHALHCLARSAAVASLPSEVPSSPSPLAVSVGPQ